MFVVERLKNSKGVQGIPVIEEFHKVLADDLLRLPSNRKTKFVIELELATAPIRRAPYRMAPTEEMKTQIDELLEK